MLKGIKKSNGRTEPFSTYKISESVHKAAKILGEENEELCRELAGMVSRWIKNRADISTSEIRQIVVKLLNETGNKKIAESYSRYEGKKRIYGSTTQNENLFPDDVVIIDSLAKGEAAPWDKNRIAVALVRETLIDKDLAYEIADAVENKILGLRLGRISTTLVRELANHELLLRGYNLQVSNQVLLGIPKYDIKEKVATCEKRELEEWIVHSLLSQYSLQEILSSDCANGHLEGDINISGLETPLSLYRESMNESTLEIEDVELSLDKRGLFTFRKGQEPEISSHVAINLPRLYYNSKSNLYTALARVTRLAVKSIKQRNVLLKSSSRGAVSCVGLNELCILLLQKALHEDEEALNTGRNIMLYVYFTIKSEESDIILSDEISPETCQRFSKMDARLFNSQFFNYSPSFHSKCDLHGSLGLTKKFQPIVENSALLIYRDLLSQDERQELKEICQRSDGLEKLVIA